MSVKFPGHHSRSNHVQNSSPGSQPGRYTQAPKAPVDKASQLVQQSVNDQEARKEIAHARLREKLQKKEAKQMAVSLPLYLSLFIETAKKGPISPYPKNSNNMNPTSDFIPLQDVFPIALGTWVLCGMFQGGIDEKEAIATIHAALDRGVNLIDTAPLYGFGRTEELVGKALKQYGRRDKIILATKCGLSWKDGKIYRDARKSTLMEEIDRSLTRLGVDAIDLYQLHWPDPVTPIAETAEAFRQMHRQGKVRAVGLSNFTADEMRAFEEFLPIQAVQPPFNLFERQMGDDLLPLCKKRKILVLGYGTLCRGLLSGKLKKNMAFRSDDLRSFDPKFQEPLFSQYLKCVERLEKWAEEKHGRSLLELAFRWVLDQGAIPLWGPQNRKELFDLEKIARWKLEAEDFQEIDQIISEHIREPIGTEFLAPPTLSQIN